jgi:hypothetical protein
MYGIEWLLDNNMHIEAWHNILKSVIMGRLKNVRVDKLLRVLVEAEMMIFWKWQRYQLGTTHRFKKGWEAMHGFVHSTTSLADSSSPPSVQTHQDSPTTAVKDVKVSRRTCYLDAIKERVTDISTLLQRKRPELDRQRMILRQLTRIRNVLKNELSFQQHVVTEPEPLQSFPKCEDRSRTIKPVKNQYHQFKKKTRKQTNIIRTNVKSFRNNESNRRNHFQSFELSLGMSADTVLTTTLNTTSVILKVVRTRGSMTLGGISFMPTIGGIVIGEDRGG